ncbi:MAG TPA: hypothetical protein VMG55_14530 [Stellaceae bacterium]|nr:hypothetical protein [Stellaceae bacterium]
MIASTSKCSSGALVHITFDKRVRSAAEVAGINGIGPAVAAAAAMIKTVRDATAR